VVSVFLSILEYFFNVVQAVLDDVETSSQIKNLKAVAVDVIRNSMQQTQT